jgi:signal transduction histidine kinase
MNPYSFSVLCFVFCSIFVGILVWLKRSDEVGRLFLWHSAVISLWGIGFALMIMPSTPYDIALAVIRPSNGIAAFVPIAWFHFTLALTKNLDKRKGILKILYAFAILTLILSFTPWFIPKLRPVWHFTHYTSAGPLYSLLTLVYFFTVPFGFYELIKKIRSSTKEEGKQFIALLVISLFGYLGGSFSFIPVYGIAFPQYGLFLLPIYPFGLAYVITRTGIFEMEELAQAAHRDKLTAIGVLAASINHEVKNPLFIIKGLAESCLERQKEGIFPNKEKALESSNDAMRRSIEQADRAMDIIKRLSLFAKAGIDSGIKFESVNISTVLEDILPLVRYELAAHSIALTRDIPLNLPEVLADRRYLEEILFNLIVNAVQAIKDSGKPGEIKITAEGTGSFSEGKGACPSYGKKGSGTVLQGKMEPDPDKVLITIQDTGPGIPEDKLKDVFRPFYTTKAEGTGLGLYITKQLVEKIKGRIDVCSTPNVGTVFTVALPV